MIKLCLRTMYPRVSAPGYSCNSIWACGHCGSYRAFFPLCRKVWKMKFWKVPSAVRLILQLPTAHAGQWNFPKCHLPNLATERKKHTVQRTGQDIERSYFRRSAPLRSIHRRRSLHLNANRSCFFQSAPPFLAPGIRLCTIGQNRTEMRKRERNKVQRWAKILAINPTIWDSFYTSSSFTEIVLVTKILPMVADGATGEPAVLWTPAAVAAQAAAAANALAHPGAGEPLGVAQVPGQSEPGRRHQVPAAPGLCHAARRASLQPPSASASSPVFPGSYSQIFRLYVFGPSGLMDYGYAFLHCKI